MTKIKSYTVIEMLVVMIVSALSIGITYTCYKIFSNHYISYKKNSDVLAKYILMDRLLTKDISASNIVERTQEGIVCRYKKNTVQYEFYDHYILRKGTIVDTFHIPVTETPDFKKMGQSENIPGALVDAINFGTIFKEEKLSFFYKKKYGADVLMEMEETDN